MRRLYSNKRHIRITEVLTVFRIHLSGRAIERLKRCEIAEFRATASVSPYAFWPSLVNLVHASFLAGITPSAHREPPNRKFRPHSEPQAGGDVVQRLVGQCPSPSGSSAV